MAEGPAPKPLGPWGKSPEAARKLPAPRAVFKPTSKAGATTVRTHWWICAFAVSLASAVATVLIALGGSPEADPTLAGVALGSVYRWMVLGALALVTLTMLVFTRLTRGAKIALGVPIAYAGAGTIVALGWGRDAFGVRAAPIWVRPETIAAFLMVVIAVVALLAGGGDPASKAVDKRARRGRVVLRAAAWLALAPAALGLTQLVRSVRASMPSDAAAPVEAAASSSVASSSATEVVSLPPVVPPGTTPEDAKPGAPRDVDRYGDPLPHGAVARLGPLRYDNGTRLEEFGGGGLIAFSPDGKAVASMGRDGLTLWSVASGKQEVELAAAPSNGDDKVCSTPFAFMEGGATLALGGLGWKIPSGEKVRDLHLGGSATYATDGFTAAVLVSGTSIYEVFDVRSANQRSRVTFSRPPESAAFSPDSQRLATLGAGTLEVREVATNKEVFKAKLEGAGARGVALAYAPHGDAIAAGTAQPSAALHGTGSYGKATMRVYDASTGAIRASFSETLVSSSRFSPDGKTLVAWGGELVAWNLDTKAERFRLDTMRAGCRGLVFSPDGASIAVSGPAPKENSLPAGVSVIDATTGKPRWSMEAPRANAWVRDLAFSPDGASLAVSRSDGIHLLDAATGKATREPETERAGHWGSVGQVTVSPDGKLVASRADIDNEVRTWKIDSGEPVKKIQTVGASKDASLVFAPDGATLAAVDTVGAKVWKVDDGSVVATLQGDAIGNFFAFSPDGALLAEGGFHARLWDPKSGRLVRVLDDPKQPRGATATAFTTDSKTVLFATYGLGSPPVQSIAAFDASDGKPLPAMDAPARLTSITATSDGKSLLGCTDTGTATLWDLSTRKARRRLGGIQLPIGDPAHQSSYSRTCAVSPDGKTLAIGIDASLRLLDIDTQEMLTIPAHRRRVVSVAWTPDGHRLVTGSDDATALVWDVAALRALKHEPVPESSIDAAASAVTFLAGDAIAWVGGRDRAGIFDAGAWIDRATFEADGLKLVASSGDAKRIAVAGFEKASSPVLQVLDASGKRLRTISVHEEPRSLSLSPNGAKVAIVGGAPGKNTLRIFDVLKGSELASTDASAPIAFSADGTSLLAIGAKGGVLVLDPATAKPRVTLPAQAEPAALLAVSPDGTFVVSAALRQAPLRFWDVSKGTLLRSSAPLSEVVAIAASTLGVVAAATRDGVVHLVSSKSGEETMSLRSGPMVTSLSFSADGRKLAGACAGQILVWNVTAL